MTFKEFRDVGEMFDAELGVEPSYGRFRAYVKCGWGGGIQCFRDTEEAAKAELPRLFEKYYGIEY